MSFIKHIQLCLVTSVYSIQALSVKGTHKYPLYPYLFLNILSIILQSMLYYPVVLKNCKVIIKDLISKMLMQLKEKTLAYILCTGQFYPVIYHYIKGPLLQVNSPKVFVYLLLLNLTTPDSKEESRFVFQEFEFNLKIYENTMLKGGIIVSFLY